MRGLQTGVDRASLPCLRGDPVSAHPVLQRQRVGPHSGEEDPLSPSPHPKGPCPLCSTERCSPAGLAGAVQTGGAGLHSCSTAPAAHRAGACFAQKKNPLPFFCITKRKIKSGREHCFPSVLFPRPWAQLSPWTRLSPRTLGSSTCFQGW